MKAIVIGGTGLVGKHILTLLEQDSSFTDVVALVRNLPDNSVFKKVNYVVFDFDQPDQELLKGDVLFGAMGTTIKKAGSRENQYKIDVTYTVECAHLARENGINQLALVSALGANAKSTIFYNRIKGELEEKLVSLNFLHLVIVRPSLILGNRQEFRFAEKIAIVIMKLINPLFIGGLKHYRGVNAAKIAECLVRAVKSKRAGVEIIENENIQ